VLCDGYDAEGKLWRQTQTFPFPVPDLPIVMTEPAMVYNLQAGGFGFIQDYSSEYFYMVPPRPDSFYTSDALGAEGVR
jgi:hypothetical protein